MIRRPQPSPTFPSAALPASPACPLPEVAWLPRGPIQAVLRVVGTWLALIAVLTTPAYAQLSGVSDPAARRPGAIEMRIFNAATQQPTSAKLVVAGSDLVATTDSDGYLRLDGVPPGSRTLLVTADGLKGIRIVNLILPAGRLLKLPSIHLHPANPNTVHELGELEIRADALETVALDPGLTAGAVPLARVVVTPSHFQLGETPTAFAQSFTSTDFLTLPYLSSDVYRAVDHLPGVASNDLSARFWVRGAPNEQVLTRFDGVELLEPFHLKDLDGAVSAIDVQHLERLDLFTGGFTAEFGDRLAGVLLMESANAAVENPRTTFTASLTQTSASDLRRAQSRRWGSFVSLRYGDPGRMLRDRASGRAIDAEYGDFTAKLQYHPSENHELSFHLFSTRDQLEVADPEAPTLESEYNSLYAWARWKAAVSERFFAETVASLGELQYLHRGFGQFDRQFDVDLSDQRKSRTLDLRHDANLQLSERWLLRAGFEAKFAKTRYDYRLKREKPVSSTSSVIDNIDYRARITRSTTLGAGYIAARFRPAASLVVEPGARFEHHSHTAENLTSPRLNASYELGRTTLRAAWGEYYQTQGVHEVAIADRQLLFQRAERAEHRMLSAEWPIRAGFVAQVQVYQRISTRLRARWENLVNVDGVFPELLDDRRRIDPVRARSEGVEIQLARRSPLGVSWAARYSFSGDQEWVRGRTLRPSRHQPHAASLDVSYAPSTAWRFSLAWQYHSGRPTTEVTFSRTRTPEGDFYQGTVGTPYAQRLPDYHRLDVRVARTLVLRQAKVTAFVDVFNAYNRTNVQGYRYAPALQGATVVTVKTPLSHLSRLPNVGVTVEF